MSEMHRSYRNFRGNPVEFVRQDLERASEFVTSEKGGEGYLRGVDFYGTEDLYKAYRFAVSNFYKHLKRLPEISPPKSSADHMFLSKFFRYFPMNPNPAAKHTGICFLSEALRPKVILPTRLILDQPIELSRIEELPSAKVYIKLALGNADAIKTDIDGLRTERQKIIRHLKRRNKIRYGVSWGEWIYGFGDQKVLVEEDISDIATGDEYQFFVRGGKVRLFRKCRNLHMKGVRNDLIRHAHFYPDGRLCKGSFPGKGELDDTALPDTLDLMICVAEDIGTKFDAIRVDFFDTAKGVMLGELTCFSYNARLSVSTPELEALLVDAMAMTG